MLHKVYHMSAGQAMDCIKTAYGVSAFRKGLEEKENPERITMRAGGERQSTVGNGHTKVTVRECKHKR